MKRNVLVVVEIVLLMNILAGCANANSPSDTLPDECLAINMLIYKEDIGASYSDPGISPMSDAPVNSASRSYVGPDTALNRVLQSNITEKRYQKYIKYAFRTDKNVGPWSKPTELSYQSTLADEFEYGCGFLTWGSGVVERQCKYVARFRDYLVSFGVGVGSSAFSYENFEAGMKAIDREMAECFQVLDAQTPVP